MLAPKDTVTQNFAQQTFTNSHKTAKFTQVFSLESFPLYGIFHFLGTLHFLSEAKLEKQQQLCSCKSHFLEEKGLDVIKVTHHAGRVSANAMLHQLNKSDMYTVVINYVHVVMIIVYRCRKCNYYFLLSLCEQEQSYRQRSTAVCLKLSTLIREKLFE